MFVQLPIVAFVCAVLVLVPVPWHWRAGNVSTLSISAWLFVSNIIYGVGAIVWADTVLNVAPVYCDIATKLQIGSTIALPAAMFSLCMHLERVSSIRQVRTTRSDKRRRQVVDIILCFGVPAVYMAVHYVVQGHRFDIVEGFGCRPTIYESIASVILMWIPPLLFSLGGCIFAAMAFAHFWQRRATFAKHLQNSNSTLTTGRYFRLMTMAIVEMIFGLLVISIDMWFSLRGGLRPWISWDNVHSNFSEIAYFPLVLLPKSTLSWVFAIWVTIPIASLFFFGFFAFGQDAIKEYSATFSWIRRNVLRLPDRSSTSSLVSASGSFGSARMPKPELTTLDLEASKVEEAYPSYTPRSIETFDMAYTPSTMPYRCSQVDDDRESIVPPYVNSSHPVRSSIEKGDDCEEFTLNGHDAV
ncbi:hypothetical protein HYDPIDRAFT_112366 [Hydnomerulius pinastri MD-312]|uniref:Uncharacterized protein n=1 Tax=Hydnomerulius pinastri MD-312 TaxID=994086 RepID=A0A0C9WEZ5_9AGAM|nr:hypothetical protein HYDPIDRAFT_112366 [Hydnomerulius pinastri MD-312]